MKNNELYKKARYDLYTYLNKSLVVGGKELVGYINLDNNTYARGGAVNDHVLELIPMTEDEIDWLDACILADKFVPKDKIIESRTQSERFGLRVGIDTRNVRGYNSDAIGKTSVLTEEDISEIRRKYPQHVPTITTDTPTPYIPTNTVLKQYEVGDFHFHSGDFHSGGGGPVVEEEEKNISTADPLQKYKQRPIIINKIVPSKNLLII